jgi:outer membrane protein OmpA-like peptidoglycan-associated protein
MKARRGIAKFLVGLSLLPAVALAQIEGGAERYRFEPGDTVLYQTQLEKCPVGEYLSEWKILRGSYECARFQDRIWMRPLESGTTLYLVLPQALPDEFSLEFHLYSFEAGRPIVRFALHPEDLLPRLRRGDEYAADDMQLLAGVLGAVEHSLFGAKDNVQGNLEGRWDFRTKISANADHHIAVQVRRGQARFFLDGERVGHKPFRPEKPLRLLTLYFRRTVEAPEPFAKAPVLVRDIRIAAYRAPEAAPQAERDLIRDLGAQETPEGLKVTLPEAILFDFGRWELKPEARATLEKLAQLAKLREGTIRVEGHTDNVGPAQLNQVLSELRAYVVALELVRLGVDPKGLEPRGYGPSKPVAPNDSDVNRARNRRVEVILGKS